MQSPKQIIGNSFSSVMKKIVHSDSFQNIITGMGIKNIDKTASDCFKFSKPLTQQEITDIYIADGFGAKIIDRPVIDMTRKGYVIENDKDDYILKKQKELKVGKVTFEGLTWDRLYGGALFVFGLGDGSLSLKEPLNEDSIQSFDFIQIYDRFDATISEFYINANDPEEMLKLGQAKIYHVRTAEGASFEVHESRTFKMDGLLIPNLFRKSVNYWGLSWIQRVYTQLIQLGASYSHINSIMADFIIGVLSIKDLADTLQAEDDGGDNIIMKRMNQIDMTKSNISTVMMDSEETFTKVASAVNGLDKLSNVFIAAAAAVSYQPLSIFMGTPPQGMDATGDNEIRMWYDYVTHLQDTKYLPVLEAINKFIMLDKSSPFNGKVDEDVNIVFNPLWLPTEQEQAETEKLYSEAGNNNIVAGAITSDELRETLRKRKAYELSNNANLPKPDDDKKKIKDDKKKEIDK
jgi:phage-related protein (TIGR01555 family)